MEKKKVITILLFVAIVAGIGLSIYYTRPLFIEVDEIGKNVTISEPGRNIHLQVTGISNVVRVDKNTNVINVTMLGIKNRLVLCYGIHNPQEMTNQGMYDFVDFIRC